MTKSIALEIVNYQPGADPRPKAGGVLWAEKFEIRNWKFASSSLPFAVYYSQISPPEADRPRADNFQFLSTFYHFLSYSANIKTAPAIQRPLFYLKLYKAKR
jgi:hypothetical protein